MVVTRYDMLIGAVKGLVFVCNPHWLNMTKLPDNKQDLASADKSPKMQKSTHFRQRFPGQYTNQDFRTLYYYMRAMKWNLVAHPGVGFSSGNFGHHCGRLVQLFRKRRRWLMCSSVAFCLDFSSSWRRHIGEFMMAALTQSRVIALLGVLFRRIDFFCRVQKCTRTHL